MTHAILAAPALLTLMVAGPQSASWALMILGVAAVGAILRRRRAAATLAV